MSQIVLELKGISKTFPGVKALNEMQLQVYAGEVHALMGENGAGKSTLMNIINGPAPLHHLQPRDPDVLGEQSQLFYAFLRHFSIILSVFLIWTVCLSFPSGFYVLSAFLLYRYSKIHSGL